MCPTNLGILSQPGWQARLAVTVGFCKMILCSVRIKGRWGRKPVLMVLIFLNRCFSVITCGHLKIDKLEWAGSKLFCCWIKAAGADSRECVQRIRHCSFKDSYQTESGSENLSWAIWGPEPGTAETALCRGPSYEQGILGVPSFSSSSVDQETEEMGKSEETPVATGNVF